MDLSSTLSIAAGGLSATEYEIGVVSQNVSNASTSGYVTEVAQVYARDSDGSGSGVGIGVTTRDVDNALEASLYAQNASVAAYTTEDNSLAAVTAVQGSTSADSGSSTTLSDQLGNVSDAITSLISTPTSSTASATVVSDAQSLVGTISTLSNTYQTQRQASEDSISATIPEINTDLTTIGALSSQITALKASGASVADLENQRASAMSDLSSLVSVSFTETANGNMVVKTADGTELPTQPDASSGITIPTSTWPLSTTDASLTVSSSYSGTGDANDIPGIMLDGTDITSHLTGGTLGANITLRDDTYPTMQAQLDSFSYTLANRFNAAGLTLFTDSTGNMPSSSTTATTPSGIVGLSASLEVNPTYTDDSASLVTDGDTTTLQNVLSTAFGSASADVSGSLAAPVSGLGTSGTLSAGYSSSLSLADLATTLTASQGQVASDASTGLTTATSIQTSLTTKVSSASGVNVDDEMASIVALQNAYTANAKVITAIQSMYTSLFAAIT